MKWTAFLFFLLLLSSCSSFGRMKYRHVRKVPATPVVYEKREIVEKELVSITDTSVKCADVNAEELISTVDTVSTNSLPVESIMEPCYTNKTVDVVMSPDVQEVRIFPLRRDFSLLVALILIFASLILMGYCIFLIPYLPILLGFRLILEAMFVVAAWKCLKFGIGMFIARFRTNKSYKEN